MTKQQTIRIFSTETDNDIRYQDIEGYTFAANWLTVPVHLQEAIRLAQYLPIVFRKTAKGRLDINAVLSQKDQSVITASGQLNIPVCPDFLALYPFTWVIKDNNAHLAYHKNAPHFSDNGPKLVTSKGKPTQKLNSIFRKMQMSHKLFNASEKLLGKLDSLDLLTQHGDYFLLSQQPSDEALKQLPQALKLLLQQHLNSLKYLNMTFTSSDESSTPKEKTKKKAKKSAEKSSSKAEKGKKGDKKKKNKETDKLGKQIKKVCEKFSVTPDDLKSRKRGANLISARSELARNCQKSDLLPELARELGRSTSTVLGWINL